MWQTGHCGGALAVMLAGAEAIARNRVRAQVWADAGVQFTRAQVIDADAAGRIEQPDTPASANDAPINVRKPRRLSALGIWDACSGYFRWINS